MSTKHTSQSKTAQLHVHPPHSHTLTLTHTHPLALLQIIRNFGAVVIFLLILVIAFLPNLIIASPASAELSFWRIMTGNKIHVR